MGGADHLDRGPSDAERLAADHPEALIWREVQEDGTHGDWIADLHFRLRAPTPKALGALLVWTAEALQHSERMTNEHGGKVAFRLPTDGGQTHEGQDRDLS